MAMPSILGFLLSLDTTTILIATITLLVVAYIFSMKERAGIPPGPRFLPIVGNILNMRGAYVGKRYKYFEELKEKYGDIFRIYLGPKLVVVLNSFQTVNEVFVKQKETFAARPTEQLWGINLATKNGRGIIWSNGDEWKTVRRTSLHALRDLGVGKSSIEEKLKEEVCALLDALSDIEGEPVCVHKYLMKATTNIICGIAFGTRFDYNNTEFLNVIAFVDSAFRNEGAFGPIHVLPLLRFTPFLMGYYKRFQKIHVGVEGFILRRIKEHKETFNKDDIRDFIDACLSNREKTDYFDDNGMLRAIIDLFTAGSDTTAGSLDWGLLYMILNPDIQKKCQEEIDSVVGSNRMVSLSDKSKLPYVEATILEVQRLGNTAPASLPHMANEDAMVNGYLIPKGSMVYANLYGCHLDSKYWDDPKTFKPERFLGGDGKLKKQPSFVPFSAGSRICPGESLARMELFLFFSNILQRFTVLKTGSGELSTEGYFGISMSTPQYFLKLKRR
ncbi:cytochrome P450 2U1 [Patella vulgata]|uniref:cytochrome P450 2U1 n=1 Tax=Patella vulgata TaxID=6465 RepID=UPI00217FA604|nr:cytochrome P450 2U1 [Patella vulgata]